MDREGEELRADNKNLQETEIPSEEEVNEVIDNMKNNKSPGKNKVMAENIKYGGEVLRREITELIRDIWMQETMPEGWKKSIIVPLYKKGEIEECKNYRGITLLDVIKGGPSIGTFLNFVVWQHQTSYRPEILTVY